MQPLSVGLIGGSGYTGIEAARLLARHPALSLRFAASDQWRGRTLGEKLGIGGDAAALEYVGLEEGATRARETKLTVLATPAPAAAAVASRLLEAGVRVIDLSGAHRLRDPRAYPDHYDFAHPAPALLSEAVYGLPEIGSAPTAKTRLVANPGCYATAVTLALFPLLARKLVDPTNLIVDAGSGVTGAGRKAAEEWSFSEVADDVRAYRVLNHQHTPEIEQTLAVRELVFTPHLLPVRRGILATAHVRLSPGVSSADLSSALSASYQGRPFVRVLPNAEAVSLRRVVQTGRCDVGVTSDGKRAVVTAALDNLLKGAASQAIQNLNLMLDLPEDEGLGHLLDTPA